MIRIYLYNTYMWNFLYNGTGSFPGVKCGRGVLLTTHPLLVPRSWKIELYLYPPSGPHRACNGKTLPLYIYIYKVLISQSHITVNIFLLILSQSHITVNIFLLILSQSHITVNIFLLIFVNWPVGVSSMDDYYLPLSLTPHLLIAPLGVDCKFAVLNK